MSKAYGYVRVSTQDQADSGLSIAAQERRITQYCEYKGLELTKIIKDEGVSAYTPLQERPGGGQLVAHTSSEEGVSVVAIKLDRLFRDAHDCLGVTKDWNTRGVTLHLLDLGVDTASPMGRAFLTNAATYAELERNLISERTKEALHQIKIDGGRLGADSFGWERTEDVDKHGRRIFRANPLELETIGTCKALRDSGLTLQQIADKFNREGVPTKKGGRWFPSTVRNYCTKK